MSNSGILEILEKLLRVLGIIEEGESVSEGIFDFLSNELDLQSEFEDAYGWDTPGFDHQTFLNNLKDLFDAVFSTFGKEDRCNKPDDALFLEIPLLKKKDNAELGVKIFPIPEDVDQKEGLALVPYGAGENEREIELKNSWKLIFSLDEELGVYGIDFRPSNVEIRNADANVSITAELKRESAGGEPLAIPDESGTRLELKTFSLKLQFNYNNNELEYLIAVPIEEVRIVIQSSDGDGFIQKVLPKDPITIDFAFTPAYSNLKGFHFQEAGSLEVTIPINKQLGPIYFDSVDLELGFEESLLRVIVALTASLEIGPFSGVVEKIGLKADIPLDTPALPDFSFKPPTGIGLAIDANGIAGGGYLSIDPPNYAGILNLAFKNQFEITAITLITTQLPNNQKGFSFLLSLMGSFNPGIQLGYGFVLSGIGGLIGINRRMNKKALLEAQATHSLGDILFPENPIANATHIINTISNVFPPEDGYYVFGPMVELFWGGAVRLVEFSVGIFIELGGDGLVALMGNAHAALPTEETSILVLNLDILGVIDFGDKTLDLRASIYDSVIAKKFILTGDMALKANWGENPDFALSIGGWHPRFTPPPDFPEMKRMGVSLGTDNPRMSLSLYLAITTNTFQTGAAFDLYASLGNFSASAALGFDALIRFKPFMFDVGVYGRAAIKYKQENILSADLELNLKGPNPFHAKGHASFAFLCWDITLSFDKKFGKTVEEDPVIVSPLELLLEALETTRPIYELPNWADEGVNLTEDAESYISPVGNILITQNAVPLDLIMEKCGVGVPDETERILTMDVISGDEIEELEDVPKQNFAPAQFKNLTDDEKLSAPAFEKFNSGIRIGGLGKKPQESAIDSRLMEFETILIVPEAEQDLQSAESIAVGRFSLANLDPSVAKILNQSWSMQGSKKYMKPNKNIVNKETSNYVKLDEQKFTVTQHDTVKDEFGRALIDGNKAADMTYFQARDLCNIINDPQLQVMSSGFSETIHEEEIGG